MSCRVRAAAHQPRQLSDCKLSVFPPAFVSALFFSLFFFIPSCLVFLFFLDGFILSFILLLKACIKISIAMKLPPLDKFPLLVLETICAELAQIDTNKATLFAFASVSKDCCYAARKSRFASVTLNINPNFDLDALLDEFTDILKQNDAFRCVERLTVRQDPMPYLLHRCGSEYIFDKSHIQIEHFLARVYYAGNHGLASSHQVLDPTQFRYEKALWKHGSVKLRKWNDKWKPLSAMLRLLPSLKDLIFDMDQELPPTILATLHTFLPRTNLHMASLRLSSFKLPTDAFNVEFVDVDNMNLLSSPSLKSIFVHENFKTHDHFEFDAVKHVALHLAPRLKHLWIHAKKQELEVTSKANLTASAWRSPQLGKASSWPLVETAKLFGLHLVAEAVSGACLMGFSQVTDFTALQHLSIRRLDDEADQVLAFLATNGLFIALENVSLTYDCSVKNIDTFLSAISPLTSLALHGPTRNSTFSTLATHHNTLRHLRIHSGSEPDNAFLRTSLITQLETFTPQLESLEIQVRRLSKNEDETKLYHAIGQCPRLRQVALELHYDKPIPALRDILGKEAFKDSLIGAAVDEELVRSIFRIIATTQACLHPEAAGLQCLKVSPYGGCENHDCGRSDINVQKCKVQCAILKSIARSWICETSWSETMKDGISVRPAYARNVDLEMLRRAAREFPSIAATWKDLWPCADEVLFENWSSFSLKNEEMTLRSALENCDIGKDTNYCGGKIRDRILKGNK